MATQTQEVTQRLAPFQEDFLADIFAQAEALKGLGMPFAPQQLAGLSKDQLDAIQEAREGIGAYQPYMAQAQRAAKAAQGFTAPGAAQQFFNPYETAVVDQAMADIARAAVPQRQALSAQGVQAGAFGGSRGAIAQGELNRNILEQQASTAARLRASGFSDAQRAAQQAAQLSAQQSGIFSGLGSQAQAMGIQDVNSLLGIGSLTQQSAQQALDVQRQNMLAQMQLPFQQVGFLSDIFRGVPALQQTTTQVSTPPPSLGSQLTGLGIAGIGAIGQAGGFGNFFG